MKGLVLVGTVHLDPDGHAALLAMLHELKPDAVTVEVSSYAIEYRRTAGPELLSRLEPFRREDGSLPRAMHAVVAQLRPPFEYTACEAYADRTGAQLELVGDGQLSRQLLDRLEKELMVTDNLVALATRDEPPLGEQVRREWARAHRELGAGPVLDSFGQRRMERLNRRMARQIRAVISAGTPCVHVGGWAHLPGLAEELGEYEPRVRLLRQEQRESGL